MAKKKQRRATVEQFVGMSKSQLLFVLALAFIVAVSVSVLSMFASKLFYEGPKATRIADVFQSLQLSDQDYSFQTGENAGFQRKFGPGGDRDWTSYVTYLRGASLNETNKELRQKIEAAGFAFVRAAHEGRRGVLGSVYTNDRGEYLYLTVSSKQWNNVYQNAALMHQQVDPVELEGIDPQEGPVEVFIKLNINGDQE